MCKWSFSFYIILDDSIVYAIAQSNVTYISSLQYPYICTEDGFPLLDSMLAHPHAPHISMSPFPLLKAFFYTSQPRMHFAFWLFSVLFCYFHFFFFFSGHIFDFRRLTIKSASLLPPAFSKKNNRHYFHMTVTYRQDHDMMFLIYNIFIYLIFFLYFWHFLSSFFFLNVFLIFFSCLSIDIWSEWQLAMMFGYL